MKYILKIVITSLFIFFSILLGIICFPEKVFYQNYDSLIQDKYNILMNTNEPKIIIVGGSNAAFGIDQDMLEKETGYKISNLGLHAGFGNLFITELAKQNINEGDIILLAYEYGWELEDGFKKVGAEHVMAGIDDNLPMYKHLICNTSAEIWKKCLGYIFDFAKTKCEFVPYDGTYSRSSFSDSNAQFIVSDDPMEWNPEQYGALEFREAKISAYSLDYLIKLRDYVKERGAKIYFISPPVVENAVECDINSFYELRDLVKNNLKIEYISDPVQYFYPCGWMYDSIYHCNGIGQIERTKMLIDDLRKAGII